MSASALVKAWRGGAVFAIVFASLGLAACDDRLPDYSYKMTVYAGGKAFSSVRHVAVEEVPSIVDSGGTTIKRRVDGQAVILDLGGSTYYALLAPPGAPDYPAFAAGMALAPLIPKPAAHSPEDNFGDVSRGLQAMVKVKGPHDLPREIDSGAATPRQPWPMFVTFDDPSDPTTVREVSPTGIGVSRITIEITHDDVTTGIEDRLPWLPGYKKARMRLSGNKSIVISHGDHSLAEHIGAGEFTLGED
jgi:hypothetical protein